MADKRITELNLHTSLTLSDIIPIVSGGETKKTTYGSLYYGIREGVVSGSSQISFNAITDKPTLVSGSSQVSYLGLSNTPNNIVSSSQQITLLGFVTSSITGSSVLTASFDGGTRNLTFTKGDNSTFSINIPDNSGSILPSGVVSGSSQIDYPFISNIPVGIISGSSQISGLGFVDSTITGSSLTTASLSGNTITFTKGDNTTFGFTIPDVSGSDLPSGVVSGSSQIDYPQISNIPAGIVSGSSQVSYTGLSNIPTDIVSSSQQITDLGFVSSSITGSSLVTASLSGNTITFTKGDNSSFDFTIPDISGSDLPAGLISGSSQLTSSFDGIYELQGRGILSGSISYTDLTNIPSNIISSSEQLPNGIVSSSQQITDLGFVSGSYVEVNQFNSFTQSYYGDSSSFDNRINNLVLSGVPSGTVSSSQQITNLGFVSSSITGSSLVTASFSSQTITFTKGDGSTFDFTIPDVSGSDLPAGVVSGSSQLTSSYDLRYALSGSVQNIILPSDLVSSSQQITNLGFVSSSITGSSLVTASINAQTLTFTKGDGSSFNLEIPEPTGSVFITGSISTVDYIDFNTNYNYNILEGRLGWDNGEGTLQLTMDGGNVQYSLGEQIINYVYNSETSSLTKGQVVLISGSQGNRIAVRLADNSGDPNSAGTLGFVAETIPAGGTGWVVSEGPLRKINTLGLTPGHLLYLGETPGTFTQTKPQAPRHEVRLGYVERVSATVGSIFVKVDNGYEIGELHDVVDSTTTASYGDLLMKSGSIWVNNTTFSSSISSDSASAATQRLQNSASIALLSSFTSSYETTGRGIVSGSSQVISLLPSGTISGSSQLTGSFETTGRGIISSSAQIDILGYTTTSSFNAYTSSTNSSITNLNSFTSSANSSITNLNLYTASAATLSGNNTFTGTNVFSGSTFFSGSVVFEETREVIVLDTNFGLGTRNFNYNSGTTFYLNNLTGSGTWNVQNFVSASQRVTPITFVVEQGATPYSASVYQLGGTTISVKWQNGSTPAGTANKTDVFSLSIFVSGSTFNALGSYSTFG